MEEKNLGNRLKNIIFDQNRNKKDSKPQTVLSYLKKLMEYSMKDDQSNEYLENIDKFTRNSNKKYSMYSNHKSIHK